MQIIQNHALISLLNLQVGSAAQVVFNGAVMNTYKSKITPFVDINTPKVEYKPMPTSTNKSIWLYLLIAIVAICFVGLALYYLKGE